MDRQKIGRKTAAKTPAAASAHRAVPRRIRSTPVTCVGNSRRRVVQRPRRFHSHQALCFIPKSETVLSSDNSSSDGEEMSSVCVSRDETGGSSVISIPRVTTQSEKFCEKISSNFLFWSTVEERVSTSSRSLKGA